MEENNLIPEESIVRLDTLTNWQNSATETNSESRNGVNEPKISINVNINKRIFLW